jgi:NAD(P)-dependent dehydrogenase (short-subunit alcohol dehydrogenase family)
MAGSAKRASSVAGGKSTAARGRRVQQSIDRKDRARSRSGSTSKPAAPRAPRTAPRPYPASPLPAQHQVKPGRESKLNPPPMYGAPHYRGSGKLDGKVALVTGGDSGIGRSVAVLFAREGADVAIVYLDEHEDAETTARAVEAEGRRCLLLPGDVTSSAFCNSAVRRTVRKLGHLNILVNNAGFQEHCDRLEDLTDEHLDLTVKTNLHGYVYMARAALPHLHEGDSIIMTGSVTGIRGNKELLDYSMTKGGIHALTRALSANVLDRGIRVNCVAPGPVWTPFNPADRPASKAASKVAQFGAKTPMKRPAQPEEIAPAFVFFAAPSCSSYITGEILPIIGGY